MSNNYNYYQTQYQQPQQYLRPQVQQGLKGRPVASLEEARASSIDFDGSVFIFPDLANRCIYTKQINMDGTATLNVYELKELPIEKPAQYVTREEFDAALQQIKMMLAPVQQPVKEELKSF